jgi:hypothetical protein
VLAVERTHRLRADRAWLPRRVRHSGRAVTGAIWAGAGAVVVGAVAAVPATLLLWKGMLLGGAGLAVMGERVGNALVQRQLRRMARGEVELAEVTARAEGELVVVRGTVEVEEPLRGVLVDAEGAYRRMIFSARGSWVHEAAVDFSLIDDAGHRILIQAAGARWLAPPRELMTYPATRLAHADAPPRARQLAAGRDTIEAAEQVLQQGERVQIVGYKTASTDVTGEIVDYRSPPQRATLRSGPELPLVITRLADLAG